MLLFLLILSIASNLCLPILSQIVQRYLCLEKYFYIKFVFNYNSQNLKGIQYFAFI